MKTTIEYNSKLATGDKVIFSLDGEKFTGVVKKDYGCWIAFTEEDISHSEIVDKIFSYFGISDRYNFRNRVIGRDWDGSNGTWPYTGSLEELKKMLDEL